MRTTAIRPVVLLTLLVVAVQVVVGFVSRAKEPHTDDAFAGFTLPPAQGALTFVGGGAQVVPEGEVFGVFFLDIATGNVEGWYDPRGLMLPGTISGDNRLVTFFAAGASPRSDLLLVDRQTASIYSLDGLTSVMRSTNRADGGRLASSDGKLLLRRLGPDGGPWFAVLELNGTSRITRTFKAAGDWGLISPDGAKVALYGDEVFIADVASGVVRATIVAPPPPDGKTRQPLLPAAELRARSDGRGFVLTISPLGEGGSGSWSSYSWSGELAASGRGTEFYISPDAAMIAVNQIFPAGEDTDASYIGVYETSTGSEQFRVVGVSRFFGMTTANRWLADNSGIVVSSAGNDRSLAMRGGQVIPAPGVPSPTSANLFAWNDGVVDAQRKSAGRGRIPVAATDFVPPWGDSGTELRFRTPQLGHDCCGANATLVQPYVETPPYVDPPRLRLGPEAVGQELWDAPDGKFVVGVIADTLVDVLHETKSSCGQPSTEDDQECSTANYDHYLQVAAKLLPGVLTPPQSIGGQWALVTMADGQKGWLLLRVSSRWL